MSFPDACLLCGSSLSIWGDEARCSGCGVSVAELPEPADTEEVKLADVIPIRKDVL